jgi:hypothetical protein
MTDIQGRKNVDLILILIPDQLTQSDDAVTIGLTVSPGFVRCGGE